MNRMSTVLFTLFVALALFSCADAQEIKFETADGKFKITGTVGYYVANGKPVESPTGDEKGLSVVIIRPDGKSSNPVPVELLSGETKGLLFGKVITPPAAAKQFAGHYYMVVHEHGIDWQDARDICKRMGGDLVCINSEEERQFLHKIIGDGNGNDRNFFIGAHRANEKWEWIDGTKIKEAFWFKPPTDLAPFKYGYMNSLGTIWNNTSPSPTIPGFICEWTAQPRIK
ncbi:C-type lectin domain-containing protein [Mariniblastus sp.]|nr:C-type lectin domain-containing protein [Mariniblastus sp.]